MIYKLIGMALVAGLFWLVWRFYQKKKLAEPLNYSASSPLIPAPLLKMVLLALCVGSFVVFAVTVVRYLPYPHQIEFGEGFNTYIGKLWADGQWSWDVQHQPYMVMIYGFVYPMIITPLIKLFGVIPQTGRVISVAATMVGIAFLYLMAKHLTKERVIAGIVALLPFSQPTIRDWAFMGRTDMLGMMFGMMGVYIAIKQWGSNKIFWSIPLFALAFFTKQNMVMGMLAIPLASFIQGERRRAVYYGIASFLTITAGLGIGAGIVGFSFIKEMVLYNRTVPMFWGTVIALPHLTMVIIPLLFVMALAAMQTFKDKASLPAIWFAVSLAVFLVLIFREGGYINYGIELIFASCLCAGLWLKEITVKNRQSMIALCLVLVIPMMWMTHAFPMPDAGYDARCREVISIIKDTTNPIVTENAGLILEAGNAPYLELFTYLNMTELGYWDDSQYLEDLRSGYIKYLVLHSPATIPPTPDGHSHFSVEQMDIIAQNYHIVYDTYLKPDGGVWWYSFVVYEHN